MKYPKDFKFLAQSMSKSSLYVIKSGKIELRRMGKPVYTLKKCEFFGENNIYGREKKIPVAFTAEETVVIQLTKDMVEDRLGQEIKYVILRNIINTAILESKFLHLLSNV